MVPVFIDRGARRAGRCSRPAQREHISSAMHPESGSGCDGPARPLLIDGIPSGRISSRLGLHNFVSWTGLDIGRDRGSPVSDYASPFAAPSMGEPSAWNNSGTFSTGGYSESEKCRKIG
jgi:hypothetical protein